MTNKICGQNCLNWLGDVFFSVDLHPSLSSSFTIVGLHKESLCVPLSMLVYLKPRYDPFFFFLGWSGQGNWICKSLSSLYGIRPNIQSTPVKECIT